MAQALHPERATAPLEKTEHQANMGRKRSGRETIDVWRPWRGCRQHDRGQRVPATGTLVAFPRVQILQPVFSTHPLLLTKPPTRIYFTTRLLSEVRSSNAAGSR